MFAKRCLPIAVLAALCFLYAPGQSDKQPLDVRVMSYNIRYGTAQDGDNHWDKRKEFLVETIQAFNPDLLGTQETLGFQRDYRKLQMLLNKTSQTSSFTVGLVLGKIFSTLARLGMP
jgi:hypothetical protein